MCLGQVSPWSGVSVLVPCVAGLCTASWCCTVPGGQSQHLCGQLASHRHLTGPVQPLYHQLLPGSFCLVSKPCRAGRGWVRDVWMQGAAL